MLSLLILSADVGYGLARDGISAEAALLHLKMGGIEAVCGALGFALFYSMMRVFLKGRVQEPAETSHEAEENFYQMPSQRYGVIFPEAVAYTDE